MDRIHPPIRIGHAKVPSIETVIRALEVAYGVEETELKTATQQRRLSEARAVMGWLAMGTGCSTLTEVGRRLNRDVGTMSSAAQRLVDRSGREPALKRRLKRLGSSRSLEL